LTEDAPLQFLKNETQGACCLVPLCVLQRPVALLLAGGVAPSQSSIDALSVLAELTVLRLENIALKILYELTAERKETVIAQEEPALATSPVIKPEPASTVDPVPEPVSTFDLDSYAKPAPAEEPVVVPEEAPSAQSLDQVEPAEPVGGPEPSKIMETRPLPEEERLHSDAKRFARLLVAEIKLYNEHHVAEGRENQDLYLRLKRDIDRSREMYEKRVSPNVSRKIDYFHDEVIRILGDNDRSTLGSDYPGPRVES
jgi:hypothetical protein